MTRLRVRITGRVQGVGFRYWTEATATGLGLAGWVRNRRDGAVEAVFQGEPKAVEAMVEACRAGPRFARVAQVESFEEAEPVGGGFHMRPTV